MNVNLPIILIGPMATGKSSVADELSKQLAIPRVPMDRVRWYYYMKDGFSMAHESSLVTFTEKMAYWKPFELGAVKKITSEFPNSVIDFGAGHSYFPDQSHLQSAQEHLAGTPNIFLLLPCEDKAEALKICNDRLKARDGDYVGEQHLQANQLFIEHPSNSLLAKQTVYTLNQTPEETARRIIQLLK